jgi:hypothetical protein
MPHTRHCAVGYLSAMSNDLERFVKRKVWIETVVVALLVATTVMVVGLVISIAKLL